MSHIRSGHVVQKPLTLHDAIEFLLIEVLVPFTDSSLYEDYRREASTCTPKQFDDRFDGSLAMLRRLADVERGALT